MTSAGFARRTFVLNHLISPGGVLMHARPGRSGRAWTGAPERDPRPGGWDCLRGDVDDLGVDPEWVEWETGIAAVRQV